MSQNDLELDISFAPSTAEAAAERQSYAEGTVFSVVKSADKQRAKKKPHLGELSPCWLMFKLNLTPLADPEDASTGVGRGINTFQCLPFMPPHLVQAFEDGELEEEQFLKYQRTVQIFAETTHNLLHALMPEEVPDVPRKVDGELTYKGEVIEREEYEACKVEALLTAGEFAETLWKEGPDSLVGLGVYHDIAYEKNKETGEVSEFPSAKRFSAQAPTRDGLPADVLIGAGQIMPTKTKTESAGGKKKASSKKKTSRKRK